MSNMKLSNYGDEGDAMPKRANVGANMETSQGTVLIVEDQPFERRLLTQTLKHMGLRVYSTNNSVGALKYSEHRIDLVLTDLDLGGETGIDLLKHWKELPEGNKTAFVFITGERDLSTAVEAMKQGAFDYLSKPVRPEKLAEVVNRAIAAA